MASFPRRWIVGAASLAAALVTTEAGAGQRVDDIKQRGFLVCGVSSGIAGFALADAQRKYSGLEIDICRAVSISIFGAPDHVKYTPALSVDAFRKSGEIDIVVRRLTWTLTREASLGLLFGPIYFYDGQGFLAPKKLALTKPTQLSGKTVCVQSGEGADARLAAYARGNRLHFKTVVIAGAADIRTAFLSGQCDVLSADVSELASIRSAAPQPAEFDMLPQQISKEPLAPLIRQGDDQFFEIVRWTLFAMIDAEEMGLTSRNIDEKRGSADAEIQRFLGVIPGLGEALGLDRRWAYNIVKQIGNYGEMFDRNLGAGSPIKLDRGQNRLWTEGGLMYAPPTR